MARLDNHKVTTARCSWPAKIVIQNPHTAGVHLHVYTGVHVHVHVHTLLYSIHRPIEVKGWFDSETLLQEHPEMRHLTHKISKITQGVNLILIFATTLTINPDLLPRRP